MKRKLNISKNKPGFTACSRLAAICLFLLISVSAFTRNPGNTGTAIIGNRVWFDANANGIQDATETAGISGVTIKLKNAAGTVIATATTNTSGIYTFTGLNHGTYIVNLPVSFGGRVLTAKDAKPGGIYSSQDSDPSQTTGDTDPFYLHSGENYTTKDAGYRTVTLLVAGGAVWCDFEKNGIKNTRVSGSYTLDRGISGITVKLYADADNNNVADSAALADTTTNTNGEYRFTSLLPGNYIIGVVIPSGFSVATVNGGDPDNNLDNDNNGTNTSVGGEVKSKAVTISGGQEPTTDGDNNNGNLTVDFGFDKTPVIDHYIPCCATDDGVIRFWVRPVLIEELTTPYFSYFSFAYQYKNNAGEWICFSEGTNSINGKTITAGNVKGSGSIQLPSLNFSPLDPSLHGLVIRCIFSVGLDVDACTMPVGNTLNSGNSSMNSTVDLNKLGCNVFGSIGNRVWKDVNGNGIQDAGELGRKDVQIALLNSAGQVIANTITNVSGNYKFNMLVAGNYKVRLTLPPDSSSVTAKDQETDDNSDSDFDRVTLTTDLIILAQGQNRTDIDAGLLNPVSVFGNVWHDINGMADGSVNNSGGQLNPPAAPIPTGLYSYLVNSATGLVEKFTKVNPSGTFAFSNVTANTIYTIVISDVVPAQSNIGTPPPASTLPDKWEHTGQKNANPPNNPAGSDGINDGILQVPVGTSNVFKANFGIQTKGDIVNG